MLLVVTLASCAVAIMILALPMMRRRVRPNGLYGLRTPATFADETVWYEANARSGFELLLLGLLLLVLSLALPLFGVARAAYGLLWSAVAVIGAPSRWRSWAGVEPTGCLRNGALTNHRVTLRCPRRDRPRMSLRCATLPFTMILATLSVEPKPS